MFEAFQDERNLLWLGTGFYTLAFCYAILALWMKRAHRLSVFYLLLTAGFAFQSSGLYQRGLVDQSFPLNNNFEVFMVIGWSVVILEFIIRPAFRLRLLGFFTSAQASLLGWIAFAFPRWDSPVPPPTEAVNPWIGFHAALAVFSYAVFALLATTALMYLLQHYALRQRQNGGLFQRLPSVAQLDDINKRLLLVGVSILTLAIALGFANYITDHGSVSAEKLLIALTVWALYLFLHQLRARKKLIASQFAWTCLVLFGVALLSLTVFIGNPSPRTSGSENPSSVPLSTSVSVP